MLVFIGFCSIMEVRGGIVNKLNLLIVEDDNNTIAEYKANIKADDKFYLVGTTNSSSQAVEMVKQYSPHAVILDLELHQGSGNGLMFLKALSELGLKNKPFILVVTNNISTVTHSIARNLGADFVITKNQSDFSCKMVLEFLESIAQSTIAASFTSQTASAAAQSINYSETIKEKISTELDLIGVSPKLKGRQYLADAVEITCSKRVPNLCGIIAQKYKKTDASVERAMQTAINHAWRNTDIESLERYYTTYINPQKGVPTVMEFIYYYSDKIKKSL